jgi:hypothetical protein
MKPKGIGAYAGWAMLAAATIACSSQQSRDDGPANRMLSASRDDVVYAYTMPAAPVTTTVTGAENDMSIYAVRSRFNNIYGLAVNTHDIPRATGTVQSGGRVFLRAPGEEPLLTRRDDSQP